MAIKLDVNSVNLRLTMKIEYANKVSDEVVTLLRDERMRQGISQYKLAQGCGLSKTSIAYIERKENKPTLRTLVMIADYLDVDLSEYLKQVLMK